MTLYTKLGFDEGMKYFPNIGNLIFQPLSESDFWPNRHANRDLRDCSVMTTAIVNSEKVQSIHFCTNDAELITLLTSTGGRVFVFGAYNQVNVYQMRAEGSVTQVAEPDVGGVKELLRAKARGNFPVDGRTRDLSEDEILDLLMIIDTGTVFRFQADAYAYHQYERG